MVKMEVNWRTCYLKVKGTVRQTAVDFCNGIREFYRTLSMEERMEFKDLMQFMMEDESQVWKP